MEMSWAVLPRCY